MRSLVFSIGHVIDDVIGLECDTIPESELVNYQWEIERRSQPEELKDNIVMLGFQMESLAWMSQQVIFYHNSIYVDV